MANTALVTEPVIHEEKMDRLAEVAVRVGLGLKAGQELVMTASIDALPLARTYYGASLSRGRFTRHHALHGRCGGADALSLRPE